MNAPLDIARRSSVCPHDCPSVCALDVEVIGGNRIGRLHGAPDHPYTQGVVCAKVARYPSASTTPTGSRGPCGALARKVQRSLSRSLGTKRSTQLPRRS